MIRAIGFIPARYESTRFPGKPLALICGRPMIQHVYTRACRAKTLDRVVVATDDHRILECVHGFGGEAIMTSRRHASGTDRIVEALKQCEKRFFGCAQGKKSNFGIVVNIQGDEPLVEPRAIDALVRRLWADPEAEMATPVCIIREREVAISPDTVKVALDVNGRALYFSRSPIPYYRHPSPGDFYYKHIGIYAYRRSFLERFKRWGPGRLERAESLEQLRALEKGASIAAVVVPGGWPAVDTPQDLEKVERLVRYKEKGARSKDKQN